MVRPFPEPNSERYIKKKKFPAPLEKVGTAIYCYEIPKN
jgi:hypothetical protein